MHHQVRLAAVDERGECLRAHVDPNVFHAGQFPFRWRLAHIDGNDAPDGNSARRQLSNEL